VHNHDGITRTASVRLAAPGLALDPVVSASQQITLPANGTVAVGWPVVAGAPGEVSIRMDLVAEDAVDAVELPLPIHPRAIPQVDTVAREVEAEWAETITLPAAALPDLSRWELPLAPSIATGMLDGLEFLIDYPFG
jgi:hypothetical protein